MVNTLSVGDLPQVAALGGRVSGMLDILKTLKNLNIDMPSLLKLAEAIKNAVSADTTRAKVIAALDALKIVSKATATPTDDKIVAGIESILSGPALDLLCSVVDSYLGNRSLALAAVEADAVALGIDWSLFLEIAKIVAMLIRSNQS